MILPGNSIRVYDSKIAKDKSFFTGHMNLQKLQFDPFVGGYAFIIWVKVPKWLEETFPGFVAMTQKNFKSFDGISDIDLGTDDYHFGFNSNAYGVATSISKGNTEFTLKHQEYSGSPIKNMYQFWVSSIRDPRTDIATYPTMFGCEYSAKNHTGELLYIVTRPDVNNVSKKNIEFAAYYTNVFPTKIPLGHLNYSEGDHALVEIDIPFKGNMNIGPKIDAFAAKKLKETYNFVTEGFFDPTNPNVGGDNLGVFNDYGDEVSKGDSGDIDLYV